MPPRLGDRPLTNREKQARREERYRRMKEALERLRDLPRLPREAREIIADALDTQTQEISR